MNERCKKTGWAHLWREIKHMDMVKISQETAEKLKPDSEVQICWNCNMLRQAIVKWEYFSNE